MPWVSWMENTSQSDVQDRCVRVCGGSLYHNYKGFYSIVLLAMVGGDHKFLWADVGAAGPSSDAQILKHSDLKHKIEENSIGFPETESMVDDGPKVNLFILGDDAFPLKLWACIHERS